MKIRGLFSDIYTCDNCGNEQCVTRKCRICGHNYFWNIRTRDFRIFEKGWEDWELWTNRHREKKEK